MEHNAPKISKRRTCRAACLIVFVSACRFSSAPSEQLGADAAESQADLAGSAANSGDAGARTATQMVPAAQGSNAAQASNAAQGSNATQGSNAAQGSNTAAAGSGGPSSTTTPITAHAPPPTSTAPAAAGGAPATDLDAGSQAGPDGTNPPSDTECANDLANCLLKDPLNYAECLRINADHGCPEPDAGTSTTSPVTTEDGKPLSQACQAELANCIARNPTPENAGECTEKARKCK